MSEFHQEGIITTIHNLFDIFDPEAYLDRLEKKLEESATHMRICLLLPSLHSEIHVPGVLDNIIANINKVNYIHNIVIALGGAKEEAKFKEAKDYFGQLAKKERDVKVVWVEGPRVQKVFDKLNDCNIETGVQGKGQSVWMTMGYLFAKENADVIALHDCDIVTYDRLLLGRLIEPTANPYNDFEFCKGYYARVSPGEREMKGRVSRLFISPFVEILRDLMHNAGDHALEKFFRYHRAFRYPLAGEFSFLSRLARGIKIAYDWGLEVSTLSEVYERVVLRKIAQVDLTKNYEHKHQDISAEDAKKGLHRMVIDITKFYLNYIRSNGHSLGEDFIESLKATYLRRAGAFVKIYSDDAEANDLVYNRHKEENTVEHFASFIGDGWEEMQKTNLSTQLSSWNRVAYSVPGIFGDVVEAVEADNSR